MSDGTRLSHSSGFAQKVMAYAIVDVRRDLSVNVAWSHPSLMIAGALPGRLEVNLSSRQDLDGCQPE